MRATRSSSRPGTTSRVPTSWSSSTSPRRATTVRPPSTMVRRVADEVYIPFTVGGGIRTLEDARRMLRAGADKVSVNTAAVERPELISEIAAEFGVQCVVCAIDAKRRSDDGSQRTAGRSTSTAVAHRPASTPSSGPARRSVGAPARSCSPRWIVTAPARASISSSTQAIADAVDRAGDRERWRRLDRSPRRGCGRRAAPTACSRHRSSTSGSTPSPMPRRRWLPRASPFGPSSCSVRRMSTPAVTRRTRATRGRPASSISTTARPMRCRST